MKKEPIAIVGIGAMFPGSEDVAAYWNNSLDAKCFIREIPILGIKRIL
jgi:acyl transferase domain-containing protein